MSLQWTGANVVYAAPYRIPCLFSGSQLISYAIFSKEDFSIEKVKAMLEGKEDGKSAQVPIVIQESHVLNDNLIHTLAASRVIKDLESGIRSH